MESVRQEKDDVIAALSCVAGSLNTLGKLDEGQCQGVASVLDNLASRLESNWQIPETKPTEKFSPEMPSDKPKEKHNLSSIPDRLDNVAQRLRVLPLAILGSMDSLDKATLMEDEVMGFNGILYELLEEIEAIAEEV